MSSLGFGHRRDRRTVLSSPSSKRVMVSPAESWTGAAGSGFSKVPTDGVRTTAKPAMRLVVPPNQSFTDELLVGVYAGANFAGSLLDNMGLEKVRIYYEGNVSDIRVPTFETFADANGLEVTYFGWWARLKHDGRNGDARIYFEAIPKDPTMQRRVIGPFLFLPSASLYDLELTVAPSRPEVVGLRYQSISAALTYCAGQARHRPRITIIESRNDYMLNSIGAPFSYTSAKGYATIEAIVPVTIIGTKRYVDATPRTKFDGLHFRGANIVIDMKRMALIHHEGIGNLHWFDGVIIVNSGGRGYTVPELRGPRTYGVARNGPYLTECVITAIPSTANGCRLVRGNMMTRGFFDATSEAHCVIGNRIDDYDAYDSWAKDTAAFTVTYAGPGTTATLELTGFSNQSSRTFTAKVNGAVVGTQVVTNTPPTSVSTVASWLGGLAGWSANVQSNAVRANLCSIPNNIGGAFSPQNVKNETLQIVTFLDAHGDLYQTNVPANTPENVVIADNVVTNFAGQCFFLSTNTDIADYLIVNNAFHGKAVRGWTFLSQWGRAGTKSHIVMAHNSSTQALWIRPNEGMNADAYCLLADNALGGLAWNGTPDPDVRISDNHLFGGNTAPAGGINTTIGGDAASLWRNAQGGDFTPRQELLLNPKVPSMSYDQRRRKRATLDCAGIIGACEDQSGQAELPSGLPFARQAHWLRRFFRQ